MDNSCGGFESYLRGSWWDVQIAQQRSDMFLVSYKSLKKEESAWVPMTELRLVSRKADSWDCNSLEEGKDVAVYSKHPHFEALNTEALYDARISSVTRSKHSPGECSCRFSIHFFSVKVITYTFGSIIERTLLTDIPETKVSISNIRVLQRPTKSIPFDSILKAHMGELFIPMGRDCMDVYSLKEIEGNFEIVPPVNELKRCSINSTRNTNSKEGNFGEERSSGH